MVENQMQNMFAYYYTVWGTACLVLLGFWLYGRYLEKDFKGIYTIPTRPVVSYWEWLSRAYRQESTREFILRIMCAICIAFSRFKVCMLWIGIRPVVFFFKPDTVEALLNNSKTISKSIEYRFLEPWLGTGLLTSTSDKWRSHRKLLTPSFHFQILETFQATFNREAAVLVDKLTREAIDPHHYPGWTDVVPTVTLCTLDTVCQTAMGVHLDVQSGRCLDYVESIDQITDAFFYRAFRPWLWSDRIFFSCSSVGREFRRNVNAVQDFTKKVIKDKKESMLRELESGDTPPGGKRGKRAFLELLLELHLKDEAAFTEENIREEVDTFMFEGHDTTAMSISWTLYLLGLNPEIQDQVQQELDGIFGEDREREVNTEHLKGMKYLECAIKESLRLYPSVAFIGRKLTESLKIDDSITIPPGCTCFVNVYMLHRDPEQFPRPEVFDPDRFLPDNGCDRHPYSYIPFSAGPRNCIGQRFAMMEEKTVLSHLLRRFKVTSLDPRDRVRTMAGLIMKNLDPIRIRFELR